MLKKIKTPFTEMMGIDYPIIAGRVSHTSNPNYKGSIGELIQLVLNKL
jgi:hypothetical protein